MSGLVSVWPVVNQDLVSSWSATESGWSVSMVIGLVSSLVTDWPVTG